MILKPCPFCGFNNIDSEDPDTIYPVDREKKVYILTCNTCYGGCDASVLGDSVEDCITNWERRTNKED
jgi:hypothetical protein